jgi:DNA-binding response OmpR family regulator
MSIYDMPKTRVLIIDDEVDLRDLIRDIIADHVDEVVTAQNAKEALKALETGSFHLVISDIMMPDMNGIDLLKKLHENMHRYPVLFVSASDAEEVLSKALQYGAADFVSKPFEADDLLALVKKLTTVAHMMDSNESTSGGKKTA